MPAGESNTRIILRAVLIVVAVVMVLYVIYQLRRPISWLVIAAFIAIALSGPVNAVGSAGLGSRCGRPRRGTGASMTHTCDQPRRRDRKASR